MFTSLTTKLAMKKMGIPSDTFNFSMPEWSSSSQADAAQPKKLRKAPPGTVPGLDEEEEEDGEGGQKARGGGGSGSGWAAAWMSPRNLPLTVQPWLSPPPPAIPVAASCPRVGEVAPLDRDRKLTFGGGRKVLVVFLRCPGCAFAQKTFLALRALANRHAAGSSAGALACVAVSHASPAATRRWLDLLGGAWNVQVVVDEDRAVYAAWGLGLGSVWSVLNPGTQLQGWRETGWLGRAVAGAVEKQQRGSGSGGGSGGDVQTTGGSGVVRAAPPEGFATAMGNKWQLAGAFAVDGRGTVVWGHKALRADDVLDLDAGVRALGL